MKTYETPEYAIESAYNNGYKKGYEDGFKEGYEGGVDVGKRNAVKHGRWIPSKSMAMSDKCSVCHGWVTRHSVNERKHRYCPNCGAKMDGGNEDG